MEQDVTDHLYTFGNGLSQANGSGIRPVEFKENSPVKYAIEGTEGKWIVFTVPQGFSTEHWEYNSKPSMKNLGFMPAFESSRERAEILYPRFYHICLPSYIISTIVLIVLGFCYRGWSIRLSGDRTV